MKLSVFKHGFTNHVISRMNFRHFNAAEVDTLAVLGEIETINSEKKVIKKIITQDHLPYLERMLFKWKRLQTSTTKTSGFASLITYRISGITKLIKKLSCRKKCTLILTSNEKRIITVY